MTRTHTVDPAQPDPATIAEAAAALRAGALVAFPTETVYGLGAHALDAQAISRLYAAKGRPAHNPVIVHVGDAEAAQRVAAEWPEGARRIAEALWPGPVTLVLPKRAEVPDTVTAGGATVAVRMPAHPVALALIRAAGVPVAAPSANRSTEVSPTSAAHVRKSLGDAVDIILDAGPTHVGIESTVVDLTGESPVLLRPGTVSPATLERLLGRPITQRAKPSADEPLRAPGMLARHYAPRTRLLLASAGQLQAVVATAGARGDRVGGLLMTRDVGGLYAVRRLPPDPAGYARGLYDALHALDEAGCAVIVAEMVPEGEDWLGVRDRLLRASTPAS